MKKSENLLFFLNFIKLITLLLSLNVKTFAQTDTIGMPSDIPSVASDRFGNTYSSKDLQVKFSNNFLPPVGQNTCLAGFFKLDFVDPANTNFNDPISGPALRNVICQVFTDISSLIIPANNPWTNATNQNIALVNIRIEAVGGLPPTAVASASSLYNRANNGFFLPGNTFQNGILDGEVWKTINSGFDSWYAAYHIFSTNFYHGVVNFNSNQLSNFCTDLTNPCLSPSIDLYQVTLHEATHLLGFNSLMTATGGSVLGGSTFYSRYDTHLKETGDDFLLTPWQCNNVSYNALASTEGGCNAVFVGAMAGTQPIYAPGNPTGFQPGSSLSHFAEDCPPMLPYVMNYSVNNSCRRHYTNEEVGALCDLGYHTTSQFGTNGTNICVNQNYSPCGSRLAGTDDIFDFSTYNTARSAYFVRQGTGAITINDFLNNDEDEFNASGIPTDFECPIIIKGGGSIITGIGSITYTPALNYVGWAVIRYVPLNVANNVRGNFTYIYIRVLPPFPIGCNMIAGGDFEIMGDIYGGPPYGFLNVGTLPMTASAISSEFSTPDFISFISGQWRQAGLVGGGTGTPYGCNGTQAFPPSYNGAGVNNSYMLMVSFPKNREGIILDLSRPIVPNQNYSLSFWANAKDNQCAPNLNIYASEHMPCIPPTLTSPGLNNCDGSSFTLVPLTNQPLTSSWQQYTLNFNYAGLNPANYLIVYPDIDLTPPFGGGPVYVDDFVLNCLPSISETITQPCGGQCNGSIALNVNGCNGPYTYQWSNSATTSAISNLCPGTYTITVTDANGCINTETYVLVNSVCSGFTVNKTVSDPTTYAGFPVTYTITITNNNPTAEDFHVYDLLPINFYPLGNPNCPNLVLSYAGGPLNIAGNTGLIAPGGTYTCTFTGAFALINMPTGYSNCVDVTQVSNGLLQTACANNVVVAMFCPLVLQTSTSGDCTPNVTTVDICPKLDNNLVNITSASFTLYYPSWLTYNSVTLNTNAISGFPAPCSNPPSVITGTPVTIGTTVFNAIDVTVSGCANAQLWYAQLMCFHFTLNQVPPIGNTGYTFVGSVPAGRPYMHFTYSTNSQPENQLCQIGIITLGCPAALPCYNAAFSTSNVYCTTDVTFTPNTINCQGVDPNTLVHRWYFNDNTTTPMTGTGSGSYTHTFPSAGTYTVVHTVFDFINMVSTQTTQQVTVQPACCVQSVTINNGDKSNTMGSGLSYTTVDIRGVFEVNSNFTFQNCQITMEPGAQIVVKSGAGYLSLLGSNINSCSQMWKGIVVEGNATADIYQSYIGDAETGITAKNNSSVYVQYSYLYDCVVGIMIPQKINGGVNSVNLTVDGTTFAMLSPSFKPYYPNQPTHGTLPKAGIDIQDVTVSIGGYSYCTFRDLATGVMARRSTLWVNNSRFYDISGDTYYGLTYNGAAVASEGNNTIPGMLLIYPTYGNSIVTNAKYGVYTDKSYLAATYMNITGVTYGVYCIRTINGQAANVESCTIDASRYGIQFTTSNSASSMYARYNNIRVWQSTSSSFGINITQSSNGSGPDYHLEQNVIEAVQGYGIYANAAKNVTAIENQIMLTGNTNSGIQLVGCDESLVSCNTVKGKYPQQTYVNNGIYVGHSLKTILSCNLTDSLNKGIYFEGVCTGTDLKGNTMKRHLEGLRLYTNAVIDTQAHKGNQWIGPWSSGGYGANNLNNSPSTNLYYSKFLIDNSAGAAFTPSVPSNNIGWILPQSGNTYSCTTAQTCISDQQQAMQGEGSGLQRSIAQDELETEEFTDESKEMAKGYLYKDVKENANLAAEPVFAAFALENENTAVDFLYEAGQAIRNATELSITEAESIGTIQNSIELIMLSVDSLDSIHAADSLVNITTPKQVLLDQISVLSQNRSIIIAQHEANAITFLNDAEAYNNQVVPEGMPQQNEKFINTIEIEYLRNSIAGIESEFNTILVVAQQCPHAGGTSVYRARSFISMFDDAITYDDATVCTQAGYRKAGKENENVNKSISVSKITVVPNPATDVVSVIIKHGEEAIYSLELYNSLNEKISEVLLTEGETSYTFDVSKFKAGVYFVKVKCEVANTVVKKIVIQH